MSSYTPQASVVITKERKAIESIKRQYMHSQLPLSVGFSGGKDSTVTLDLVFKALMEIPEELRTKTTYVLFSDTLLEMDPVIKTIDQAIEDAIDFSKKHNLHVIFKRARPINEETFFSLMVGKGYAPPRRDLRYCTDRLKIRPQERAINEILGDHKGFIAIVGSRKAESQDRKARLERHTIDAELKSHEIPGCFMLAPIEDWSSSEVWDYLYMQSQEWVDENTLGKVYSLAAGDDGDECRTLFQGLEEGSTPGCGKSARYGCWVCTLFEKDKTLNNLGKEYEYLKDKEEFRNWLVSFRDNNWLHRDEYNHKYLNELKYNLENERYGMTMPGGMGLEFREEMLDRLLALEKSIFEQSGNKFILSPQELSYIQSCWIEEGDLSMRAYHLCQKYGRCFEIREEDKEIAYLAQTMFMDNIANYTHLNLKPEEKLSSYSTQYVNERYFAQVVIYLMKEHPENYLEIIQATRNNSEVISPKEALKIILASPVEKKQFYPSPERREEIRQEWKNDKINFWTFLDNLARGYLEKTCNKNLFGYEGPYARHYEIKDEMEQQVKERGYFDVIDMKTLSLQEQYAFFDHCRTESHVEIANYNKVTSLQDDSPIQNPFDAISTFNKEHQIQTKKEALC